MTIRCAAALRVRRLAAQAVLLGSLGASGCFVAASDERPELWSGSPEPRSGGAPPWTPSMPPCAEGSERKCRIFVDEENGVVSCWLGVQSCVDGVWTDCALVDEKTVNAVTPD